MTLLILLLFVSTPSFAGEAPKFTAEEKGVIQEIFKRASLKKALKITEEQKDDSDKHKILKAKFQYLLHLNNTWPIDEAKFKKQYLYLKRIHAIWTLPSLQDIRPLSLDILFKDYSEEEYFLAALAFHNGDVEKKYKELKAGKKLDETDEGFFEAAIQFRLKMKEDVQYSLKDTIEGHTGEARSGVGFFKKGRAFYLVNSKTLGWNLNTSMQILAWQDLYVKTNVCGSECRHCHVVSPLFYKRLGSMKEDGVQTATASTRLGKLLAYANIDGTIKIFDTEKKEKIAGIVNGGNWFYTLSFSPDGKYLAAGSRNQRIFIWDVRTARQVQILKEHQDIVNLVVFHPNGKYLISGSLDKTLKIWSINNTINVIEPNLSLLNLELPKGGGR